MAIGKVGDLITLYTSNRRHAVPDKLDWLIAFLDQLRHGPHVKNRETHREIQKYVTDLSDIHRDLSGRVFEDPAGVWTSAGRAAEQRKFYEVHRVFMGLRGFLRDLEATERRKRNNGSG